MSNAKTSFEVALKDVSNILKFHEEVGGQGPGRRPDNLSSLNKSGIVLLCATWESYIEFVIVECVERQVAAATTPDRLRKSLSKMVSAFVRNEKDERAWHAIAGEGWRGTAISTVKTRVATLNTPKTKQVSGFFYELLGIKDIEDNWLWQRSALGVASRKLDEFVTLRGSIAHGEVRQDLITKAKVTSAQDLITRLVERVESRLADEGLI